MATTILSLKPARSIADQITLLETRGMVFSNKAHASEFLQNNNYYRLNIYFHQRMTPVDQFVPGTTFEQIERIYNNDQWLRHQLFTVIEPIEIKLRSNMAYYLGIRYGSDCFYDTTLCEELEKYISILSLFYKNVGYRRNDPVIQHHIDNYGSRFPIWAIVENFSLGETSKYYSSLKASDKRAIAKMAFNNDEKYIKSWVESVSVLRNICAHYGYLHERKFTNKPLLSNPMKKMGVSNEMLFGLCVVIKEMTDPRNWAEFVTALDEREKNDHSFVLAKYGFPSWGLTYLH